MRNRFQNMMDGRYGNDQLNNFMFIVALVLVVLSFFVNISLLWIIAVVLLILGYFRMLSRNIAQRSLENERFTGFISRFRRGGGGFRGSRSGGYGNDGYGSGSYGGGRSRRSSRSSRSTTSARERAEKFRAQQQDKRYYKYFNCPNCNQKVRVPKGKGKIEITCPKCRTSFIRKT